MGEFGHDIITPDRRASLQGLLWAWDFMAILEEERLEIYISAAANDFT